MLITLPSESDLIKAKGGSTSYQQVSEHLWVSVYSSVKWGRGHSCLTRDFIGYWAFLVQGHLGNPEETEGWTSLSAPRLTANPKLVFNNPFWN